MYFYRKDIRHKNKTLARQIQKALFSVGIIISILFLQIANAEMIAENNVIKIWQIEERDDIVAIVQ